MTDSDPDSLAEGGLADDSLAETLDAVNEAFFYGRDWEDAHKEDLAVWIAARQGQPRAYAGMCAPTERDFRDGIRVFTGEVITSRAATGHILGEEASRALALLAVDRPEVRAASAAAARGILSRIYEARGETGTYCCGKCSAAYWRNLSAGSLGGAEARLAAGLQQLKSRREGAGRWKAFPFYYTVLALSGIDLPDALEELRYAAPSLERLARRPAEGDRGEISRYDVRRRDLAQRVLSKI